MTRLDHFMSTASILVFCVLGEAIWTEPIDGSRQVAYGDPGGLLVSPGFPGGLHSDRTRCVRVLNNNGLGVAGPPVFVRCQAIDPHSGQGDKTRPRGFWLAIENQSNPSR